MQQLILDLLSFSRVNAGERKFENINLEIIIDKLKMSFHDELQEKNATIEATGLCALNIIPFQFEQLFQNLISNALKFSNPGITPHITIHGAIEAVSFKTYTSSKGEIIVTSVSRTMELALMKNTRNKYLKCSNGYMAAKIMQERE